ncbi:MAG TPA: FHA domain-containing protein [Gammaproteobacteria bacterium]
MSALAIEINDSGLVVADAERVLAVEPGYALAERGKITTGTEAYRQARLKPRQVSNRYWSSLSLDPDSAGLDGVGNAAELAYAQLSDLWKRFGGTGPVVFVVPGYYSREQLGLLVGLAEECGVPVAGLVDAAAAASARPYPERQLVYVDAGLHRISLTLVDQADEAIAAAEQGLQHTGLAQANDMLARFIAERFVLATRFDPFHDARSEQALYDGLPGWLRALHDAEQVEVELVHADEPFRVTIEREHVLGVLSGFNRAIAQLIAQAREGDKGLVVQLSERMLELPGLGVQLARLDDAQVVRLPVGHAARSALLALDVLGRSEGAVKLLKHFPWRERPEEPAASGGSVGPAAVDAGQASAARAPAEAATHVVYKGVAYAVDGHGLVIGRDHVAGRRTLVVDGASGGLSRQHCELVFRDGELKLRDTSRYGTFVNEKRVVGETVVRPADVIRIGSPGVELQVIRVVEPHGA